MRVFQLEHTYMFVNPFCCCLFPSQSPRGRFLKLFKTPETFQSCKAVPKIKRCIHLKLPSVHINPLTPEYFRASESTKINHMRSNHRHKIRFQDVVYFKSNNKRAKILKTINTKDLNLMCKTDKNARNDVVM